MAQLRVIVDNNGTLREIAGGDTILPSVLGTGTTNNTTVLNGAGEFVSIASLNYWTKVNNDLYYTPTNSGGTYVNWLQAKESLEVYNPLLNSIAYFNLGTNDTGFGFLAFNQNPRLEVLTNATLALTVFHNSGNVRIGTGADSGFAKLQVNGLIQQNTLNSIIKANENGVLVSAQVSDITGLLGNTYIENQYTYGQTANFLINGTATSLVVEARRETYGGYITLISGDLYSVGRLELKKENNSRIGYIGYSITNMTYVSENGANHVFTGGLTLIGSDTVNGGKVLQINGGIRQNDVINNLVYANAQGEFQNATTQNITDLLTNTYIQNQNANPQANSTFWISTTGRADAFTARGSDNGGYVSLIKGNPTQSGYLAINKANTTRIGYIGFDNTNLAYVAENSAYHLFTGANIVVGNTSAFSTHNTLSLTRNITGADTSRQILATGQIQSGVIAAEYYRAQPGIATGATVTNIYGFMVNQGVYSGTVTTQSGFFVNSNFTGATTSNFAFRSTMSYAAGNGRWNLYMDGTARNFLAGKLNIGNTTTEIGDSILVVSGGTIYNSTLVDTTEAILKTTTTGIITRANATDITNILGTGNYILNGTSQQASSNFNISGTGTFGGQIIASAGSVGSPSISTLGDLNTGVFFPSDDAMALVTGGVNRFIISPTGSIGIGGSFNTPIVLSLLRNITGGSTSQGILISGTVQNDVSTAFLFSTFPNVVASHSVNDLVHFNANSPVFNGSVTNHIGFRVSSAFTGGSNNFGFRGQIPSGTGRWNIYMDGTAQNFLNGNTLIGGQLSAGDNFKFQVFGNSYFRNPSANAEIARFVDITDSTYIAISNSGIYMSRIASYIRPTVTNTQTLYIGHTDTQKWNQIFLDATSVVLPSQINFSLLKTNGTGVIQQATGADVAALLGTNASANYILNGTTLQPTSNFNISGNGKADYFQSTRKGFFGTYLGDGTQVQGIWSISPTYIIDSAANNTGNIHGIAYSFTNAPHALPSGTTKNAITGWGHQILFADTLGVKHSLSLSNGNAYHNGTLFIGSMVDAAQSTSISPTAVSNIRNNLALGKMDIAGNGHGRLNFKRSSDGADIAAIRLQTDQNFEILSYGTGNFISFRTESTEKMRIAPDGTVLINRTSDAGFGAKLQVQGSIQQTLTNALLGADTNGVITIATAAQIAAIIDATNAGGGNYIRNNSTVTAQAAAFRISGNGYANVFWGNQNVVSDSDLRLKTNVEDYYGIYDKLKEVNLKSYVKHGSYEVGYIAQEMQKVFPFLVKENEHTKFLGIDYGHVGALALQLGKENGNEIEILKRRITELEREIQTLKTR